jgi:uncharacterized caspase-like protein
MTYVAARQAIKTSAMDCEIRGGEYIAHDRSNYMTALNVWLPLANQGDKAAQTYVGEIYEKGLGTAPDYASAVSWYQKAAEQGHTRAQINLGYLYEQGRGVPKDPVQALSWYRRASGTTIALDSGSGEAQSLRQELEQRKQSEASLRRQLEDTRRQLEKAQQELRHRQNDASLQEQRWEEAKQALEQQRQQAVSAGDSARVASLEAQIRQRSEDLERQRQEMARLESEAAQYKQQLSALEKEQGDLQTLKQEMARQKSESTSLRQQLVEARQQAKAPPAGVTLVGPKIEIIDPPVSLTRASMPQIKTRAGVERAIVGKVTAPAGILSLTVNDRSENLDTKGLFRAQVPIMRANVPITVVAVDKQGKRADIEFVLVPEGGETAIAAAEPAIPAPSKSPLMTPNEFGPYYALVIGNNNYARLPKLDTAVNDAQAIAAVLGDKYGFKVTTLINANRYQILSTLSGLREKLTEKDNLLVYYAGHGELDKVNQRGHWLPVDAEPNSTANWISNIDVTDTLNVMSAKHVLVIADSCYSGTLTRSSLTQIEAGMTRDTKVNWFKTMTKKRSRTVLSSGGVAPVLDAGGGDHSVFAKALLDVLKTNGDILEGATLYREVAARVAYAATRFEVEQVPEYAPIKYAGHDFGDFFFVPAASSVRAPFEVWMAKVLVKDPN